MEDPLPWGYCITSTEGSQNPDFIYYLHGRGRSKTAWMDYPKHKAIRQAWADLGKDAPTIITISFGPVWFLAEKNPSLKSGLLELYADQIIPEIEMKLGGLKGERMIVAESMGSFSGAELVLKRGSLFSRAALACPAIGDLTPSPTFAQRLKYALRANPLGLVGEIVLPVSYVITKLQKETFPDEKSWEAASPLLLAKTELNSNSPALYISSGDLDLYGFYPGDKEFARIAKERDVREVIWDPVVGGHCSLNPVKIAKFLTEDR